MPDNQESTADVVAETITPTENPAAPDAATAAAVIDAAADKAAGKPVETVEAEALAAREANAAALAKVKQKYYRTCHGGTMVDPDTLKEFNGENAVKSPLTSWLDFQVKNGKIAED